MRKASFDAAGIIVPKSEPQRDRKTNPKQNGTTQGRKHESVREKSQQFRQALMGAAKIGAMMADCN